MEDAPVPTPPSARRIVLCFAAIGLFAVGIMLVAPLRAPSQLTFIVIYGVLWGQIALAAAWVPLGVGPLALRLFASVVWVGVHFSAYLFGPNELWALSWPESLVLAGCLTIIWLTVQAPLWLLAFCGWHLSPTEQPLRAREFQFGTRHLLLFTALVAGSLATLRLVITADFLKSAEACLALFGFFAFATPVVTLPLLTPLLLRRRVALALVLSVAAVVALTFAENACALRIVPHTGDDLRPILAGINLVQAIEILAATGLLRLVGYRLVCGKTLA